MFHGQDQSNSPEAWPRRNGHVRVFQDEPPHYRDPELGHPQTQQSAQPPQQQSYQPNIIIQQSDPVGEECGSGAFKYILILLAGVIVVAWFSSAQASKDEVTRAQFTEVQANRLQLIQERHLNFAEKREAQAAEREQRYWDAAGEGRVRVDVIGQSMLISNGQRSNSYETMRLEELQRQNLAEERRRSQLAMHQMESSNRAAEYAMQTGQHVHELNMDSQRRTFETGNEAIRQSAEISRLSIEKAAEVVNNSTDASKEVLLGTKQADAAVETARIQANARPAAPTHIHFGCIGQI